MVVHVFLRLLDPDVLVAWIRDFWIRHLTRIFSSSEFFVHSGDDWTLATPASAIPEGDSLGVAPGSIHLATL